MISIIVVIMGPAASITAVATGTTILITVIARNSPHIINSFVNKLKYI